MHKLKALLPLLALLAAGAMQAAPAAASSTQEALFQDDGYLKTNPDAMLLKMQQLGVTRVRVAVTWDSVAPPTRPSHASSPSDPAYQSGFQIYDYIDRKARADGIQVLFMLTGPAPGWATSGGEPAGGPKGVWKPSTSDFRAFAQAVGARYSGRFTPASGGGPLPRVSLWSIWNEPNYGPDLAPQAIDHDTVEVAPMLYRGLLDAAWSGLRASGHHPGADTILIGETAPRGHNHPIGNFNGIKPLRFLRALYCVDSRYRPLRGLSASLRGCPTTSVGSRRFRADHPALFGAGGFAAHLYASQSNPGPPTQHTTETGAPGNDPDFADLPAVGTLERTLDRLNRVYGSRTRYSIWNTEYGYRTHPPDPHVRLSQATAAYYMNWGEYISYRNPRIASYMQYLLQDPITGVFASGLESVSGVRKLTYYAYQVPLFLPHTSTRRGHSLEVWGDVRPAPAARAQTGRLQKAFIELRRGKNWVHIQTVTIRNKRGYFDVRVKFPASGLVRIAWAPPAPQTGGDYSRTQAISVR